MVSILPQIVSSPVSFPGLWGSFQGHQLELVLPSLSCFTVFSAFWQDPSTFMFFHFLFIFTLWSSGMAKSTPFINKQKVTITIDIAVVFRSHILKVFRLGGFFCYLQENVSFDVDKHVNMRTYSLFHKPKRLTKTNRRKRKLQVLGNTGSDTIE